MGLSSPCSVLCPSPVLLPHTDHLPVFQLAMDPTVWGTIPPRHVLEVGTPHWAIWGDQGTFKASLWVWRSKDVSQGGAYPKQSLALKAKLLSFGEQDPLCQVSLCVPCCCMSSQSA